MGGKPRTYQIFKQFDVDGDGFVSYKDFDDHLKKNKILASQEDVGLLLKTVLDTDGNGYIDLETFANKFGPNMQKLVPVPENESHLPFNCPNLDKTKEHGVRADAFQTKFNAVRKSFQP